jgi:hypothetical protein
VTGATGRSVPCLCIEAFALLYMEQQGGLCLKYIWSNRKDCALSPETSCYSQHFLLCYPHLPSPALKRVMLTR